VSDYWSWNNAVDGTGTTIESSTGSAGDLVTGNLRDPRVGKPWRAGGMPVTLTINLPAVGALSIVGMFGINMEDLTTLSFAAYNDGALVWTEDVDLSQGRQAVFVLTDELDRLAPVNVTQIVVTASGTIPLEIGRVWVGTADWQPEVGHVVDGSARSVNDLSNITRNPRSGARLGDVGSRLKVFAAAYDALTQTEFNDILHTLEIERGLAGQLLFVPEPSVYGLTKAPILGALIENDETTFVGHLRAARTLTIQEDG